MHEYPAPVAVTLWITGALAGKLVALLGFGWKMSAIRRVVMVKGENVELTYFFAVIEEIN